MNLSYVKGDSIVRNSFKENINEKAMKDQWIGIILNYREYLDFFIHAPDNH